MSPGRVLILDDNATVGATLAAIARRAGHEARFTTDAAEFLETAVQWGPRHLVLDLVMPETDGMQVIHALAERRCQAGLIISSGAGVRVLDAARRAAAEGGLAIIGTLAKPFRAQAVRDLLARAPEDAAPDTTASGPASVVSIRSGDLRQALERGDINVFYQPKIRCSDGTVAGFEALARWTDGPFGQPVPPSDFIPLAEREGLIDALTLHVLHQSFAWAAQLPDPSVRIAVNISPKLLSGVHLADGIAEVAARHGLATSRVVLEVTETGTLADPLAILEVTTRLRLKGFLLSIDDFGVGYSSLVQLARLPFSEIKIDAAFVREVTRSSEARKIVGAVIGLGRSLGLEVTAEGVEDRGGLDFLREAGCDLAQGYHIARPASGQVAAGWLRNQASAGQPG